MGNLFPPGVTLKEARAIIQGLKMPPPIITAAPEVQPAVVQPAVEESPVSIGNAAASVLANVEKVALGAGSAMASAGLPAAVGLATAALAQVHAGVRVEARVTFDLPGPFDPVVNVTAEARLDDGHFRIKEFHLVPALPKT